MSTTCCHDGAWFFAASRQVAAPGGRYLEKSVTTDSHLEFTVPLGNEEFAETRRLMARLSEFVFVGFFFVGGR